jgi:hypothetical protein
VAAGFAAFAGWLFAAGGAAAGASVRLHDAMDSAVASTATTTV